MKSSKKNNLKWRYMSIISRENEMIYDSGPVKLEVIKNEKAEVEVTKIKSIEDIEHEKKPETIADVTGIGINEKMDSMVCFIVLGIGVFISAFTPLYMQFICIDLIFLAMYINNDLKNVLELIKATYKLKTKNKMQAKYNGAVNMVLNAYDELERFPTVEETKNFSIFDEKADVIVPLTKICRNVPFIIVMLATPYIFEILEKYDINSLWYFIVVPIEMLTCELIRRKGSRIVKYLQILLISKPEDEQINDVISGLRRIEDITKRIA